MVMQHVHSPNWKKGNNSSLFLSPPPVMILFVSFGTNQHLTEFVNCDKESFDLHCLMKLLI
jgi:hypothetical protein